MTLSVALYAALVGACATGTNPKDGSGGAFPTTSSEGGGGEGGMPPVFKCGIDCGKVQTDGCHLARCNEKTLMCEVVTAPDGKACSDGKFCTIEDACAKGVCVGGKPNDCGQTPELCHQIACDEMGKTCTNGPLDDGSPCVDPDNLCLDAAKCQNALCIGVINECFFAPVPNECYVAVCNPKTGMCDPVPGNDGGKCTDLNDLCTVNKTCAKGSCLGGKAKDCSNLTSGCNLGVCDKANGQCTVKMLLNNDPCDDLNACTSGEVCSSNQCSGGTSVSQCKDNDKCCPASCDEKTDSDCSTRLALAADYSCARLGDGSASCWGYNVYGQLGNGSKTSSVVPVLVTMLSNAVAIAAGDYHACAALKDGAVKCWGYNAYGQLGDGTKNSSSMPVAVSGISNAVDVAAGYSHSCALLADGTVMCWGYNAYGQLGNGSKVQSLTPVAVSGLSNIATISSGYYHTCAIAKTGAVSCWGYNVYGQLGNGSNTDSASPVAATNITTAVSIGGGYYHTCAALADGTAKCWGYNGFGQLGNGTTVSSSSPVVVSTLSGAKSIALGYYHSCAVLGDGTARCWGYNVYGGLGNNTTTSSSTPVTVMNLTNARSIEAGSYHTCAVLQGSVRCWGRNVYGQLGTGNSTDSKVPVLVTGL